ncbi:HNH endonuclease [Cohnella kolymensis]|uniref:HNH endonuclease n=1 Tax=Cohnella kolymensis TaxID=1590652 RepID=UPI0009E4989C
MEDQTSRPEGTVRYFFGKRYERDSHNRTQALKIHGFICVVCKFDFEEVYGGRGKDFIEVHHTKPLYTLEGKLTDINPLTDLLPVCANCHRMIHRRQNDILDIEQLRIIVEQRNKANNKKR